jgi:peptidoglycan hydrolase-like protein with peptidoglycan-binding domain
MLGLRHLYQRKKKLSNEDLTVKTAVQMSGLDMLIYLAAVAGLTILLATTAVLPPTKVQAASPEAFVGGGDVSGGTNAGTSNGLINSVVVVGNYAYIGKAGSATNCSGSDKIGCELQIWDISDPAAPAFVGGGDASGGTNIGTSSSAFHSIVVVGNYAYIGKAGSATNCSDDNKIGCELQIWDISNPAAPAFVGGGDSSGGTNTGTGGSPFSGISVSGDYAYIAKSGSSGVDCSNAAGCEFQIWDISDPAAPAFVGGGDASGGTNAGTGDSSFRTITVSGDYAYIAKPGSATDCSDANKIGCELQIWDISNPAAPAFVGGADAGGRTNAGTQLSTFGAFFAPAIAIRGDYLYVIMMSGSSAECSNTASDANGCELKVFDISDPANPTYVGGADASGETNAGTGSSGFNSITVSGNYAYIGKAGSATDCSDANKIGCELQVWLLADPYVAPSPDVDDTPTPSSGGGIIFGSGPLAPGWQVGVGPVTTSAPTTAVGDTCTPLLTSYIRPGASNDPEQVRRLQTFLNQHQNESLIVDGVYKQADLEAVKRFQKKYGYEILTIWNLSEPTGHVYLTTVAKINSLNCNPTPPQCPVFTEYNSLTENPISPEVQKTKELLASLGFYTGSIDQTFTPDLKTALASFQEAFREKMLDPWNLKAGTGYKYKTTNKFLNTLKGCRAGPVQLEGVGQFEY